MNLKKMINIFILIFLIVIFMSSMLNFSYAKEVKGSIKTDGTDKTLDGLDALGSLDNYKGSQNGDSKDFLAKVNKVVAVIRVVGVVVSVVVLIVLGIKYMLGTVDEKAEYKKVTIYYVIGAVLLFTGSYIPNLIYILSTK